MDDNEKVAPLLDGLLREVNASCLPPAVKRAGRGKCVAAHPGCNHHGERGRY